MLDGLLISDELWYLSCQNKFDEQWTCCEYQIGLIKKIKKG
jgi:hypothetical protein